MKFLIDRNVDMRVVRALRSDFGWSIDDELTRSPSEPRPDLSVMQLAIQKKAILLTQDRDFEKDEMRSLVKSSNGVVLIRLSPTLKERRAGIVEGAVMGQKNKIRGKLLIITEKDSFIDE